MSGSMAPAARATLIYNEQTKPLANAVDRASTVLGVGSVFPVINLIKPDGGHLDPATTATFVAAFLILFFWSVVLHYAARRALRRLR